MNSSLNLYNCSVSLFNDINSHGLFDSIAALKENSIYTIQLLARGIRGFILFPRILVRKWM